MGQGLQLNVVGRPRGASAAGTVGTGCVKVDVNGANPVVTPHIRAA